MALVYLIRHGDYDYRDQRDELVGQGLTARGRLQAIATGRLVASRLGADFALVSSDFTRAKETARLIEQASSPKKYLEAASLRECSDTYFKNVDPVESRAGKAFAFLAELGSLQTTVAVCHANLIRYVLARAGNWPNRRWKARLVPLCSLSIVSFPPGPEIYSSVEAVAKVDHLPRELRDPY